MKLFDLQGKESMSVADMLSTAANRTTADVLDFAMAMKQGGSVTKLAGYDMNETVTVLEALAEAGIKNSDAGTSMKTAFIHLLNPSTKQRDVIKELNLDFVNQEGHLKSAAGLSKELRRSTEGMTKAERAKVLATLAGTDGVRTLNALYSETPKQLRGLEQANARQGTAQDIAAKKMDNLAGEVEQFKGSLETAEIQIYKGMAPALKELAHEGTEAANRVGSVFDNENLTGSQKVERAVGVLQDELGKIWDRHEMSAHLEDALEFAVNTAVPKMAEHAGELGFEAAKGFVKGFAHADFIGKVVMGAWLLNFIGGKAPFIAVGKSMGRTLGINLAEETAKTAAPLIATETAAATAAASKLVVPASVSRWTPASPALGSGAARQAAASASSRAMLEGAFGGFSTASVGTAAQKAMAQSAKMGARAYVSTWSANVRSRLPELKSTVSEVGSRFGRGLATWGLGGLVVGELSKEIVGGDTGSELAAAFQGAGAGAVIGGALAPGIGTAIGAALGGAGGLLANELEGDHLGDQFAEDFLFAFEKHLPHLQKALAQMEFGQPGRSAGRNLSVLGQDLPLPKRVDATGLRGARAELREQLAVLRETGASTKALAAVRQKLVLVNTAIRQGVKDVHSYKGGFDLLRSGAVVRMQDIDTAMERNAATINRVWAGNKPKWRNATAENMRAAIEAIDAGMASGAIETDAGLKRIQKLIRKANLFEGKDPLHIAEGFRKSWRKAGDINDQEVQKAVRDLHKMPKGAREAAQNAMLQMARGLEKQHKLPEGAADKLRSGLVTSFGKTGRESMRHFEHESVKGAKQGLKSILRVFAGNDPLMISKAFARSWDKSNGINEKQIQRAVKVLHKLPKPAREAAQQAMTAMADELQHSGKITKGAQNLRSALDGAFGEGAPQHIQGLKGALSELGTSSNKTFGKLEGGAKRYADQLGKTATAQGNFSRSAQRSAGSAGGAWTHFAELFRSHSAQPFKGDVASMNEAASTKMTGVVELANTILKGFGVRAVDFGGKEQKKQSGGFIVPGSGSGDTFKTMLPPGSFILNREATAALLGRQSGGSVPVALEPKELALYPNGVKQLGGESFLEGLNQSIPRFQKGGGIGAEPKLMGPSGGLRDLGQAAIAKVYAGAKDYLDKHKPQSGPGYSGPAFGPAGTSPYKGILMATWVRQALEYAAGHGSGDPQPTSGYRSHAENVAAGRTYFSEHEKVQYPGGAVDFGGYVDPAAKAAKDAVVAATRSFKYPLLAPIGFEDDGHASGTGHQLGGIVAAIQALAAGGFVDASATQKNVALQIGRELLGRGLNYKGAAGVIGNAWRESLWNPASIGTGGRGLYGFDFFEQQLLEQAENQGVSWTSIPFQNDFMWDGPEPASKLKGALNSSSSAAAAAKLFDSEWERSGVKAMSDRMNGAREAMALMTGSDMEGAGGEHSYKEDVPSVYRGAKTGSLNFPSVPKTLSALNREIDRWQSEVKIYRKAKKAAEKGNRPGVAQAIAKNITAIENHLNQLRAARHKLRLEKAKKAFSKKLGKKLGKVAGYEQIIEGLERSFNRSSQDVEQLVALEPQSPELPASASDKQREEAEKAYIAQFSDYVNGRERPAYEALLGKAAEWRNTILRAETFGFGKNRPSVARMESTSERKVYEVVSEIEAINQYAERVKADISVWRANHPNVKELPDGLKKEIAERNKKQAKLPFLRFEDRELRAKIGEMRSFFFPGGDGRISPPVPPLAGSGSLEEALTSVQGIHWPDQHELLPASSLLPPRVAGKFGGVIWDVQTSIEELGLKVKQAENSIGGGGGGSEDNSELVSLLKEIADRERKGRLISERLAAVMPAFEAAYPPYAGKFHQGGVVPGPFGQERTAIVKAGEVFRTPEQEAALAAALAGQNGGGVGPEQVQVLVKGDIVSDHPDPVAVVIGDKRFRPAVRRTSGPRPTAGGPRR